MQMNQILIKTITEALAEIVNQNADKTLHMKVDKLPATAIDGESDMFSLIIDAKKVDVRVERLTLSDSSVPVTISLTFENSENTYIFHKKDNLVNSNYSGRIHKCIMVKGDGNVIEENNIDVCALAIIARGILQHGIGVMAPLTAQNSSLLSKVSNTYYV